MRRFVAAFAAIATFALATAGCGGAPNDPQPTATQDGFPVTVGDVTLDRQPQRIVSLSPSLTEMLFAIDAGSQVVAVDEYSTYPEDAPRTDLSGYTPNAEAVVTYNPDLVVLDTDANGIVAALRKLDIPVYVGPAASTMDDTYRQITELGTLTGHAAEAQALVTRMKDDLAKLLADLPERDEPLTYFYELDNTYFTVTSQSFIGSLFTAAGLVNIADEGNADNPYPQLSEERIFAADPDLIFLADAYPGGETPETVAARPGWADLTAVRTGAIVALDPDVASRWGPRIVDLQRTIVDAITHLGTR
ncbi:MAG: ABC transporter substrate-binding protein [Micromonosporaceae bacterium]|nr:ABC transporter substrate-binding protein [Micromonosporaceae bacterium]